MEQAIQMELNTASESESLLVPHAMEHLFVHFLEHPLFNPLGDGSL